MMARVFPGLSFYKSFIPIVWRSSRQAKHNVYDAHTWALSSYDTFKHLERVGVQFDVTGIEHVKDLDGPCVFIGNHMSMLETVILPCLLQPHRDITFVVKESLLDYPVFKYVMRSRDPIAVTRSNPKEDFKRVLNGGKERLKKGVSIIVFPQTTRMMEFIPEQFNSIGVKLALRAKVPVVPIALKTDAWCNGRFFKDFGTIDTSRKVHFAVDKPMMIEGRGAEEHEKIIEFIQTKLVEWGSEAKG